MSDPLSQQNARPANLRDAPDEPQLHDLVPFVAGDRIFAVFAEQVEGAAEARMPAEDIQPTSQINDDGFESAVLGIARYGGEEITVLRVDRLFAAAVRRKERRKRRI